jgi:predicted enzyme related to lactoylglutathione lyase
MNRTNRPIWVDLSTTDPDAAREFYGRLFGWTSEVQPESGGYALARLDGKNVAGIGPKNMEQAPTAWNVYIGTEDAEGLASKITAAGGTVIVPPFDVMEQGKMAVFQDSAGGFISAWQPGQMPGADLVGAPGSFAWAELNARGMGTAEGFYHSVFGWELKHSPMGEGQGDYTEFLDQGDSIAGGMEMNPMVPEQVPTYWMPYFAVEDVDAGFAKAKEVGASVLLEPIDFPGGRFAIVADPQGAAFGLMKFNPEGA